MEVVGAPIAGLGVAILAEERPSDVNVIDRQLNSVLNAVELK